MATKKSSNKRKTPWEKPAPKSAHHSSLSPAQKEHAKARAKKAGRSYPNLVDNMHEAAASGGASKKATGRKSAAKKKTPAKRKTGASKKSSTKRAPTKKTSTKKTSTKRAPAKKSSAKRAPAKKSAAKKSSTKRAPAKKGAAKKSSGKRSSAKKSSAKRAPAKKSSTKRASGKGKSARAGGGAPTKDPKGGLTAAGRRMFHQRDGSNLKPGVTKPMSQMSTAEMKRKGSWAVRFYGRSGKLPPLVDDKGRPTRLALTAAAWGEPVPKTEPQARAIAAKGHKLLDRARAAATT